MEISPDFLNLESASSISGTAAANAKPQIDSSFASTASSSSSSSSWKDKDSRDVPIKEEESTNHATPAKQQDDDDEEEDVCRICRNPSDADNQLRYPCACSGSIKYVHQDCLLQ